MKTSYFLISAIAALTSVNALAVGTTGCGLGSMIFTRNSFVSQTFAATTNITGLGFSLTTGTSNCHVDGIIMNEREKEYFVESNYRHIEEEMAKGSGENLAAFAGLFGCSADALPVFESVTKSKFETIFTSAQTPPAQILNSVRKEVKAHPVLLQKCVAVS